MNLCCQGKESVVREFGFVHAISTTNQLLHKRLGNSTLTLSSLNNRSHLHRTVVVTSARVLAPMSNSTKPLESMK